MSGRIVACFPLRITFTILTAAKEYCNSAKITRCFWVNTAEVELYVIRVVHLITNLADIKNYIVIQFVCLSDVLFRLEKFFLLNWGMIRNSSLFVHFLFHFFKVPTASRTRPCRYWTDKSTTRQSPRTLSETRTGPTEFVRPGSPTKSGRAGLVEFGFYCAFK